MSNPIKIGQVITYKGEQWKVIGVGVTNPGFRLRAPFLGRSKDDEVKPALDQELTIHPTGTCFDDALDFFAQLLKESPLRARTPDVFLVHGVCLFPTGAPYAHAWVEERGKIWFSGKLHGTLAFFKGEKDEFVREFRVIAERKYTPAEAWKQNHLFVHYGPWDGLCMSLVKRPFLRKRLYSGS